MNDNSVGQAQLDTLQKKLDSAIDSRRTLEEDFKTQSTLLIQFISKLSLVSKGVDLELDNRLAKLRVLFTKSAPIADIENSIAIITKLLQQHAITNEKNIAQMHQRFNIAGESLQKVNGLPNDLRRNLRELLSETKSTKDALIQYVPLLSQLLEFYINALSAKEKTATNGLLTTPNNAGDSAQTTLDTSSDNNSNTASTFELDESLLEKISVTLSALNLSQAHTNQLLAIKKKLMGDTTNKEIVNHFLEIFDVIVAEFKNEQNNAKSFLTSLSDTLTSVQLAVKETLETQKSSQLANDKINVVLQKQLVDMTGTVEKALSLDQVKLDINDKLQKIAGTLEAKSKIEQQSQLALSQKLTKMAEKVAQLEEKSRVFEEKLAEQQIKNMQDALTKLANRAAFDDYFAKAMVRFQHRPFELALVVIDIDDFKKINDTYGHSAGDKTLQVIANTIQKHVSKDVFVGRYGGEEFVLIYSQTAETDLINELNTINKQVARLPFKFKNNKVSITLSIGATHIRTDDNIHLAFERADEAMYKAKSQGKNQVIYSK
ncbi:GGDEF domain-containing protein [Colwellia asteriadis]|uniref:diguanylate cyclase n=1 Tax=Colwellia asteriadis TaxID=517723 RepID=A0ABN1L6K1_9GAMM